MATPPTIPSLIGTYEYTGIQRCGKSTVMIHDLTEKVLPAGYQPDDVYANFDVFIEGIHIMENHQLIDQILRIKRDRLTNKVILFDEMGQELKARAYSDRVQTEVVSFAWQMPKRGIILMYCSNVGNSADVILRDATWITVMPHYLKGATHEKDSISLTVIYNYDCRIQTGLCLPNVHKYQKLFNSWQAIQ